MYLLRHNRIAVTETRGTLTALRVVHYSQRDMLHACLASAAKPIESDGQITARFFNADPDAYSHFCLLKVMPQVCKAERLSEFAAENPIPNRNRMQAQHQNATNDTYYNKKNYPNVIQFKNLKSDSRFSSPVYCDLNSSDL